MSETPRDRTFEFLLNAFEQASQHHDPASQRYGDKRRAVVNHVEKLETRLREIARLAAPSSPTEPTA